MTGPVGGSGGSPIIVALDFDAPAAALALAESLDPSLCRVKVGNELFTRGGPSLVEALQARGFDLFLDLKFHDIPNTVAAAVRASAELGVWMVNVHASGGGRMMRAAQESGMLREACGEHFALVTPGIRLAGDAAGDQRRVVTPTDAMANGSDYLVVGRSITRSADPAATLRKIHADLSLLSAG